jgi:glycosyltransferase involved in cell wall biosynthesis
MHYRVSVYNYFWRRFAQSGWELTVRSNQLQKQNPHPIEFDFKEIPFEFLQYRREIERLKPDAVIVFLRLKDLMIWPLIHWLKLRRTPAAFWMKAMNYDRPDSMSSRLMYRYMHSVFDGLILYSTREVDLLNERHRVKAFPANNTVNFESFPQISESRDEIKRELGVPFEKVVLSVGRMGAAGQRKKVHHLIEIFREIDTPGVGLVIVGSGMTPELLRALNPRNTLYLGEVHDARDIQISKIFKMADVFSIPGHVGLGLNQAFYWGLPVVTEEGRQPPEIQYLVDGHNGFIVPEDDRGALKRRILELLNDDQQRRRFSENARHDIMLHASIENMFLGFRTCVESITGQRR